MKITVYTITDCPFCKQEKDFLTAQGLQFEEKNVQENRQFLTEMLEVSDKFAGVPFTMIEKDTGEKVSLKGFTQSEFEAALGLSAAAPAVAMEPTPAEVAPAAPMSEPVLSTPEPAAPVMADATPMTDANPMAGDVAGATASSMPDATPNMPSMPGIDEAPATPMPSMPSAAPVDPSMTATPAASAPAPTPTVADPTTPSSDPANPQNQLDGLLADLQSKSQPDLPDFTAPAAPVSSDTSTQQQ